MCHSTHSALRRCSPALCAPLLLADPDAVPRSTAAFLNDALDVRARMPRDADLHVFGGNAAVSRTAIDGYLADPLGTEGGRLKPQQPCVPGLGNEPTQLLGDVFSHHAAWSPDCAKIAYTGWTARVHPGLLHREHRRLPIAKWCSTTVQARPLGLRTAPRSPSAWAREGRSRGTRSATSSSPTQTAPISCSSRQAISATQRPSWSPDAKAHRLRAVKTWTTGRASTSSTTIVFIAVMDADGSNVTPLTPGNLSRSFSRVVARWQVDRVRPRSGSVAHGLRGAKRPQDYRGVLTRMAIRGRLTARHSRTRHSRLSRTTPTAAAFGMTIRCLSPRSRAAGRLKWSDT